MCRRAQLAWPFALLALLCATPGLALIDVEPDALKHYSFCISQAKDRNFVYVLDRQLLYRCHDDVAVSYFNYLGRRHVPDHVVDEPDGVFVYRRISGVGRCWNKISDEFSQPVSVYGCDVYIDI
ncbi:MAG TPA: hypothetical protein VIE47_08615 [Methylocystis sp.]|jgi:hypothetical protein